MSEFLDYLDEVFERFGPIRVRRMFGGYGVYHDELMFALVAANVLYLKADAQTAKLFEEKGLRRFEYVKRGKTVELSYYAAPEELFDDPDVARTWAARAYEAAVRSGSRKRSKGKLG